MTAPFGMGSPTDWGADDAGFYDWGAGDPTPDAWAGTPDDLGFGDVWEVGFLAFLTPVATEHVYPDDGGAVVRVSGVWPTKGPYLVKIEDSFTGKQYPDGAGCYSARAGKGASCETNTAQTELVFALPMLPPGVYDVRMFYGPGFGQEIPKITKALRVVFRNHAHEVWGLRQGMLPGWKAGPRVSATEPKQGA